MSKIYIGKQAESLTISPSLDPYAGVILSAGTTTDASGATIPIEYHAGDISGNTGRVLEVSCPWGTQGMADLILSRIDEYAYQPLEANGAILEPTAELGDSVMVNGVVGSLTKQNLSYGHQMKSDISAPHDEEIDHEYGYSTGTAEHKAERQLAEVRSSLLVEMGQISAEVSEKLDASGGSQTCSWVLNSTSWTVKVNGQDTFKVNSNGAYIRGDLDLTGNFKIGGDTYTAAEFRNLTNTCWDNNGAWTTSSDWTNNNGSYCVGGADWGYDYGDRTINGHFRGSLDAITFGFWAGTYWAEGRIITINGHDVLGFS